MNGQIDRIKVAITAKDLAEMVQELNYLRMRNEQDCKTIHELREKIADLTTIKIKEESEK